MSRFGSILVGVAAVLLLLLVPAARADFGLNGLDVTFTGPSGEPAMQAGSHPFAMTTSFGVNTTENGKGVTVVDGALKDLSIAQAAGLVGSPTAVPFCETADFLAKKDGTGCANSTAVGTTSGHLGGGTGTAASFTMSGVVPVYNLRPAPGVAAKIGFWVGEVPLSVNLGVSPTPPYNVIATIKNTTQAVEVFDSQTTLWGNPAAAAHDGERGACALSTAADSCPANIPVRPFLTLPRSCNGPLRTIFEATSWWSGDPFEPGPGTSFAGEAETHDDALPPNPLGTSGCGKLGFQPQIAAQPTSKAASSPTGLDFSLNVEDEGLTNPAGLAQADLDKAEVTLPEGFSVNPSIAEGLEVCTEAQLEAETPFSAPGAGCPNASKIGTVEVETPLLEEPVDGALYQAAPYENPTGGLIALYIVIKNPTVGIIVKQPLRVEPDPVTGQLKTISEDLPQLPFSHFRLHFREGTRSPLVTPPACGAYDVVARLYPSSGESPLTTTSTFQVISGPNAGPCPSAGLPPFHPKLLAGTINNRAGSFSPFNVRISRTDSEQEITHFSIKLPPGVVGKLAGIATCPDAAIQQATERTGPLGGHEELAAPSCPGSSYVGRTLVGSGVGPALAYAPGRLYLAGPYHGAPLSIVAITAGVVGPFDIGTVVVREALRIDPETAEVFIDATDSDPIPHIIKGIPVHLRDIRVYTDRPEFVLNPTDCTPTSTSSTVLGSGLDFASAADDNPFVATSPFQAADCAALPFKPKLGFRLKGATHRGAHPALSAHVSMKGIGEAAIAYARVTLPHSEFLEQGHIGTICTRVQFKSGQVPGENCPAASVYGHVKAVTPILDGPLEGPIFLRSSEHPLPDLVAALHHAEINVALVGRIDSVKGQIRNTFEFVPDAPVTSADFVFGAGKKSLLVNSTNICRGTHKVKVELKGHNGKVSNYMTPLKAKCGKRAGHKRHRR